MKPSHKQMWDYLKAQGWQIGGYTPTNRGRFKLMPQSMLDPVSGDVFGSGCLELCYKLAKRRESQRDAGRLKAAGFEFRDGLWFRGSAQLMGKSWFTKSQALSTL